jgi:hypothetical protein
MTVIKVPKTPKSAYNPERPASALLQAHIVHLEHALGLPEPKRKRRRTEGAAARYIGELTSRLMQQSGLPLAAASASPAPVARRAKRARSKKPRRSSRAKAKRR